MPAPRQSSVQWAPGLRCVCMWKCRSLLTMPDPCIDPHNIRPPPHCVHAGVYAKRIESDHVTRKP
eukprot:9471935-Pyramimonas_sp.AAC.1